MKSRLPILLGILLLVAIPIWFLRIRAFKANEAELASNLNAAAEFNELQKSIYDMTLACDSSQVSKILQTKSKFRESLLRSLLESALKNDCESIVAEVLGVERLQDPIHGNSLIVLAIESNASDSVVRMLADAGYGIPPASQLLARFPARGTLIFTVSKGMISHDEIGLAFSNLPEEARHEWVNVIANFEDPLRSQIATACLVRFQSLELTPSVESLLPFATPLVLKNRLVEAIARNNVGESEKYIHIAGVVDQLSLEERVSLRKMMPGFSLPINPEVEERLITELWIAAVAQFSKDHNLEPLKALIQKRPDIVNQPIYPAKTATDVLFSNREFFAVRWLQMNGARLSPKMEISEELAFYNAVLLQSEELLMESALDSGVYLSSFASNVTSLPLTPEAGLTSDAVPLVQCSAVDFALTSGNYPFASLLVQKCPTVKIDVAKLLAVRKIHMNRDMVSLVFVLAKNSSSDELDSNSVSVLEALYPDGLDFKAIQDNEYQSAFFDRNVQKYLVKAVEANDENLLAFVLKRLKIAEKGTMQDRPNSLLDATSQADSLLEQSFKHPRILNRLIAEGFRPSILVVRSACEEGNVEALQIILQSSATLIPQEPIDNLIKTFEDSREISGMLKKFARTN